MVECACRVPRVGGGDLVTASAVNRKKRPNLIFRRGPSGGRCFGQDDGDAFDVFKQGRAVDGLQLNEIDFPGEQEIVEAGFDVELPAQV
jgi:hypothetical protein